MRRFDPAGFERFSYMSLSIDASTGTISCAYRLDGRAPAIEFEERFVVGPIAPGIWELPAGMAVRRVARLLWLAAGLSYYKAAAPARVLVPTALSAAERTWLESLYREGLGEFAFHNGVDLSVRPVFEAQASSSEAVGHACQASSSEAVGHACPDAAPAQPLTGLSLPRRSLVPVGGGKDSCATIDILQAAGDDLVLFNVGGHRAARDVAQACGLPLVVAERALDPKLGQLNAAGALNGHVPVTAIVSLVAVAQALVTGADQVVFSNERSANVANVTHNGLPVNHQYSKGVVAEGRLRAVLGDVTSELEYFSLLRPLSELHIAQIFARSDRFLPVFTSCNAAFRLDEQRRVDRWCGNCPKCRFVFLALAPFVERARLVAVFGSDLLADPAQLGGYRALLGLEGHRPFECVGEIEESQAAIWLVAGEGERQRAGGRGSADSRWARSALVRQLSAELVAAGVAVSDATIEEILTPSTGHFIPASALRALRDALSVAPQPS